MNCLFSMKLPHRNRLLAGLGSHDGFDSIVNGLFGIGLVQAFSGNSNCGCACCAGSNSTRRSGASEAIADRRWSPTGEKCLAKSLGDIAGSSNSVDGFEAGVITKRRLNPCNNELQAKPNAEIDFLIVVPRCVVKLELASRIVKTFIGRVKTPDGFYPGRRDALR